MIQKLRSKITADSGDSILVTVLIFAPLLFLCVAFAIDLSNNVVKSQSYKEIAQEAAQASIQTIDARGSLNRTSVTTLRSNYMAARANDANTALERNNCTTAEIDGVERSLPYMKIGVGETRADAIDMNAATIFNSQGGVTRWQSMNQRTVFRVIKAEIYEANDTMLLGALSGQSCQMHRIEVSAIAFGDRQDLNENVEPTPEPVWQSIANRAYNSCYYNRPVENWSSLLASNSGLYIKTSPSISAGEAITLGGSEIRINPETQRLEARVVEASPQGETLEVWLEDAKGESYSNKVRFTFSARSCG